MSLRVTFSGDLWAQGRRPHTTVICFCPPIEVATAGDTSAQQDTTTGAAGNPRAAAAGDTNAQQDTTTTSLLGTRERTLPFVHQGQ